MRSPSSHKLLRREKAEILRREKLLGGAKLLARRRKFNRRRRAMRGGGSNRGTPKMNYGPQDLGGDYQPGFRDDDDDDAFVSSPRRKGDGELRFPWLVVSGIVGVGAVLIAKR